MTLPVQFVRGGYCSPASQFDGVVKRLFGYDDETVAYHPGVDVREDVDHLYVQTDLPGFKKEDVNITLENGVLALDAERKMVAPETTEGEWIVRQRRHEKVSRRFKLSPNVDDQNVDARLEDGVLTITLKKREEAKPRKISVM